MTVTHKQVGATTPSATSVTFNPLAGGNFPTALVAGDVGDLLIAVLTQTSQLLANISSAPSGWSQVAGASSDTSAATGSQAIYWKPALASEASWTWNFTTTTAVNLEISQYHDSAGGTWTLDKVNKNAPGTNANNITPGTTGTLTKAVEVVLAAASTISGSNGGTEAIDSSFNLLNPSTTTTRITDGYLITAATTALNPSLSWLTSRSRVAGIVTFYPVPTTEGTAAGPSTSSGSATGTPTVEATAAGPSTSSGSSTGVRTTEGTASGSSNSSASAVGEPVVEASASGPSFSSGAATGLATVGATASGPSASTGAASGVRTTEGTSTGPSTSSGSAAGTRRTAGTAAGPSTSSGSATGVGRPVGSAAGPSTSSGSATGVRTTDGSASGPSTSSASATGKPTVHGTASGASTSSASGLGLVLVLGVLLGASTSDGDADGTGSRPVVEGVAVGASISSGHAHQAVPIDPALEVRGRYRSDARGTYKPDGRGTYFPDDRTTYKSN